ncbi:MAG: hypothetical protein Crog4KO_04990 [Crocinitomicaceae bacterium]
MNNLGLLLRKFSVPVLFSVIGLTVLIVGLSNGQGSFFLLAAAMILLAGVLSTLFSLGKLSPKIVMILGGVFGAVALLLLVLSFAEVGSTLKYEQNRDKSLEIAKQNMMDIRFLQKVHKEKYGVYIDNWDDLVDFAKNGTMPYIIQNGDVPARKISVAERDYLYDDNRAIDINMTESEALLLSKWEEGPNYAEFKGFVRDTQQVSILKTKFQNPSYVKNRVKSEIYPFSADSLPVIPFTGGKEQWTLKVRDSVKIGETVGPTILVKGKLPFAEMEGSSKKIEVSFGSLTTFDTEGSWEQD